MGRPFLAEFLGIQFFGEFLIDRWIINREQLLEALRYQMERNLRFGEIAVKKNLLSEQQVMQINDHQRHTDKAFGEIAVELGLLDAEQVREIQTFQRNNNVYLGEALLRIGYISEEILERELSNFRRHQQRHSSEVIEVPEAADAKEALRASVDITKKMFRRLVNVRIKTGRGALFSSADEWARSGYFRTVVVEFEGRVSVQYVLSVTRDLAVKIATAILKEDARDELDAMIEDAVKEFCNIACGNAAARLAQAGFEVDINPPRAFAAVPEEPADHHTVAFPVRLVQGGADLRFFIAGQPKTGSDAT